MLVIPVFRDRVAPVLDWCSKIVLIPENVASAASGRQIDVARKDIFGLMRDLREQGVETLICGALSPEMLSFLQGLGFEVVDGIAGEVEEVLRAYREKDLGRPRYRLPGHSR